MYTVTCCRTCSSGLRTGLKACFFLARQLNLSANSGPSRALDLGLWQASQITDTFNPHDTTNRNPNLRRPKRDPRSLPSRTGNLLVGVVQRQSIGGDGNLPGRSRRDLVDSSPELGRVTGCEKGICES